LRRVLVAEDNAINQEVITGYLERAGCQVTIAGTGHAAVEQVRQATFDLVLMDMQMPVMDGLEATRAIRAIPGPMASVPIVMLTANAMQADRDRSLDAGADEHLSKPIDRAQLLEIVERLTAAAPASVDSSSGPTPSASEVDLGLLRELREALGPTRLLQLLDKARASFEETLGRLDQALSHDDRASVARLAHALIGSAGGLGLSAASAAARDLETASRDAAPDRGAKAACVARLLRRGIGQLDELVAAPEQGAA
jgi:two-component system sensor histidine kinase/response regulator